MLSTILSDLRFAVRLLRRSPGFTAVAVLVIALDTGAVTTIFSAANAIALRPLPGVPNAEELVEVNRTPADSEGWLWASYPYYQHLTNGGGVEPVAEIAAWAMMPGRGVWRARGGVGPNGARSISALAQARAARLQSHARPNRGSIVPHGPVYGAGARFASPGRGMRRASRYDPGPAWRAVAGWCRPTTGGSLTDIRPRAQLPHWGIIRPSSTDLRT